MRSLACTLCTLFVLCLGSHSQVAPVHAHSWYPKECCHDKDCAPVESAALVTPVDGRAPQLIVTSKHGKVAVPIDFPVRHSKDGRMHVCIRHTPYYGTMDVICLFMPPTM